MQVSVMDTPVTSVTKQKARIADAPAAITVLSQDQIRRSGHTSIPELLRMVPGLNVARVNASQWAISARGFNDPYSNKLLVLQDGRTLYNPLFAGVFWEAQDYVLADLERIEVIRGPGATLWGANAVNGVINISSKSARQTQGWLLEGLGGTEEQSGSVRYGGKLNDQTYYRVYGKYRTTDNQELADGSEAHDGWDQLRGGFRIDRYATDQDTYTLQGDAYHSRIGTTTLTFPDSAPFGEVHSPTFSANGGNVLGRWTHTDSDDSDFMVQAYYDRLTRHDPSLDYEQDTFDVEFQHRFRLGERQQLVWGGGYRFTMNEMNNSDWITMDPDHRDLHLASAFVQDNITVVPDRWHLFLGSKFEVNSFSGFEVQPSARVMWTPNTKNSVWAAISRAVRTPRQLDEDGHVVYQRFPGAGGVLTSLEVSGNVGLDSEELTAYEIGYRVEPSSRWSFDVAAFFNHYEDLISYAPGTPFFSPDSPPRVVVPFRADNNISGDIWGVELASTWQVADQWKLVGSYTYTDGDFDPDSPGVSQSASELDDAIPRHQFQIHSYLDLTRNLELNTSLSYVSHLRQGDIPAYVRLDTGVSWHLNKGTTLSVYGQNLLDGSHPEFSSLALDQESEIGRSFYVRVECRF